ncbi:hypothetical protein AB8B12_34075, partial [Streptomyces sp. PGLac3x]
MSPLEGPAPVSGETSATVTAPSAPPLPAAPGLAARAEAMLLGLAAGDAAGWPAAAAPGAPPAPRGPPARPP